MGLFDELQNVLTQDAAGNNAVLQNVQDVEGWPDSYRVGHRVSLRNRRSRSPPRR